MAISIYTDSFSLQKVNWDNLFNVCRPKKNKGHKGDMNGVQNIQYADIFADGCSIYQHVELFAEREFADSPRKVASTNRLCLRVAHNS